MTAAILAVPALGLPHFLPGAVWYSPWGFGATWMRGLGIAPADIAEARIDLRAAVAVSALASLTQAAFLVWLLASMPGLGVPAGALTGAALALGFACLPMLKDRVWADRAWSAVLVDAGYEVAGAAPVGGLGAWWLG